MKHESPNKRRDLSRWQISRARRMAHYAHLRPRHGSRNPNRGRQLTKNLGFRVDQILETLGCPISTLRFLAS